MSGLSARKVNKLLPEVPAKRPSGATCRNVKRRKEVIVAGLNPKQKKLHFTSTQRFCETEIVESARISTTRTIDLDDDDRHDDHDHCDADNDTVTAPLPETPGCSGRGVTMGSTVDVDGHGDSAERPEPDPDASSSCNIDIDINADAKLSTSTNPKVQWPTSRLDKLELLSTNPQQPKQHIPFQQDIYFQTVANKKIQRRWLTFIDNTLYCKVCGCFSPIRSNDFVSGLGEENFRRASQLVKRHESSQVHKDASDAYFTMLHGSGIISFTSHANKLATKASRARVEKNRQIVSRIIDIIKFIAGQGLSYRGHWESARDLLDTNKRHGNFLELVLMMSKHDPILCEHVTACAESAATNESTGRGNFVTFLSKTFVNNIIRILAKLIQEKIVDTINTDCNQKYGAMMDGTVDVSGTDQMNIVVRYVTSDGRVQERLIGFKVITSGKGEALWTLLCEKLTQTGLNVRSLIGLSLDGASANTSGEVGVVKHYRDSVPCGYFVWGFAHQQNLAVSPAFSVIKQCRNLLGLLQETCSFFNESSRRIDIWKRWIAKHGTNSGKLKRLVKLGKTRWWSSYKAVMRICDEPKSYFVLIGTLWELSTDSDTGSGSSATKSKSDALLTNWLTFQSLLTAIVIKELLKSCNVVTKYMQTQGLDLTKAIHLVEYEMGVLQNDRMNFEEKFQLAVRFRQQVQQLVDDDNNPEFDVVLGENLPTTEISRKRRRFFDEAATATTCTDVNEKFRIEVYLPMIDRLNQEMSVRFNERN